MTIRRRGEQQMPTLYHGTGAALEPGELVLPGQEPVHVMRHEHVYATSHPGWARVYAHYAGGGSPKYGGKPRLYEVEPTGETEPDPTRGGLGSIRSLHPMRVVREHSSEEHPFSTANLDEPWEPT